MCKANHMQLLLVVSHCHLMCKLSLGRPLVHCNGSLRVASCPVPCETFLHCFQKVKIISNMQYIVYSQYSIWHIYGVHIHISTNFI